MAHVTSSGDRISRDSAGGLIDVCFIRPFGAFGEICPISRPTADGIQVYSVVTMLAAPLRSKTGAEIIQ